MRKSSLFKLLFVLSLVMLIIFCMLGTNSYAAVNRYIMTSPSSRYISFVAKLGDVDKDGVVTSVDSLIVQRYVRNLQSLTPEQMKVADLDGDGKLTDNDAELILKMSINLIPQKNIRITYLPGDVNQSGAVRINDATLLQKYVNGSITLTIDQLMSADVNGDGVVNLKDASMIQKRVYGYISCFPIEGDINGDGRLTKDDAQLILKYSVGLVEFTDTQKRIADIDRDGEITSVDAFLVLQKCR